MRRVLVATAVVAALLGADQAASPTSAGPFDQPANPCLGPGGFTLLCPDLEMYPPYDLYSERTRTGRVRLRAGNVIESSGRGPVELRGRRSGARTMSVRQRIYRSDGSRLDVRTDGKLFFKAVPGQGRYWKFLHAARFELWSRAADGRLKDLVRTGPKVSYCFRDLRRVEPSPASPKKPFYPACSQDPDEQAVTLGTSVGWGDVYPATYNEQWIDVTGLRGRFAYVHIADPKNTIFESDEGNNRARVNVRLPYPVKTKPDSGY